MNDTLNSRMQRDIENVAWALENLAGPGEPSEVWAVPYMAGFLNGFHSARLIGNDSSTDQAAAAASEVLERVRRHYGSQRQ